MKKDDEENAKVNVERLPVNEMRDKKKNTSTVSGKVKKSTNQNLCPKKYRAPTISLEGITLEMMVNKLVEVFGWEELAKNIKINCLSNEPSVKSTLNFLRKTPWARNKVELFYLKFRKAQLKKQEKREKTAR